MEKELTKTEMIEMYNKQKEGLELSITASKMHVICIMVQTALLLLITIKILN